MAEPRTVGRRALVRLAGALGILGAGAAIQARSGSPAAAAPTGQGPSIVGTWQIVAPAAPTVRILQVYGADGSLVSVGDDHPSRSPQLGTWREAGERQFLMRNISFRFDQGGNLTGSIDVRVVWTLDPTGNTMTARGVRHELDVADALLGAPIEFEARATRIVPVPL